MHYSLCSSPYPVKLVKYPVYRVGEGRGQLNGKMLLVYIHQGMQLRVLKDAFPV